MNATLAFVAAAAAASTILAFQAPQGPAEPLQPLPALTVVIDPGHGGDDRGAVGSSGIEEKHVALAVAQRVKVIGAARNLRVLMTRDDDRQLSGNQRAAFANGAGASLFISLHANASPSPMTAGAEVASYAHPPEGVPPVPSVEDRVLQVPLAGGGSRRIAAVPWDFAQVRHADVAAAFAKQVGEYLQRIAPLGPRAVYRSELRPLASVNVPAILVDLGYVSNPAEEKIIAGDDRQAALAQAIVDAVLAFEATPHPVPR